jgi:ABC-type multidrug transport system permease subunit
MSALAETWRGVIGVARRDAAIFWSYKLRVITQSFSLLFSLTLFYYVSRLIGSSAFRSPDDYFAFVSVGLVILTVLTATLTAVPLAVRQELVAGTFERFVVSPLGAAFGVFGMLIFPMASAVGLASVQLVLAALIFGVDIDWSTAPLAIPVAALGTLSFAPFALMMAAGVVMFKQVSGGVTFVTTGMAFVGGFFFPVSLLPSWISWASSVQPFTPALELLRHLLIGTPLIHSGLDSVVRIALFAVVLLPVSGLILGGAVELGRQRGTLTEY